jgi:hypothetical protein
MNREQRRALTVFALSFTPLIAYLIAPQFVAGLVWNFWLMVEGWL